MRLEQIGIPSRQETLAGLRYVPEGRVQPTALIFAHGFTSGKFSMDLLAGYLASRGYEGLTFDFVGHKLGGSGGAMTRTEQAAENLQDALDWMRRHTEAKQIVLIGHSMGAAATLAVAAGERNNSGMPPLAGIVCMCIGTEPARGFEGSLGKAMLAQRYDYVTGAPALKLLRGLDALIALASQVGQTPALFLAARQDVLISVARVEALAAQIGPGANVEVIEASHLEAPDKSRGPIAAWLERLL